MPTLWLSDSQKIGVAFCTGGGFFLLFGLILLFDRALLAMGNILFLIGITLLLGPQRTFIFFARKQKWKGTLAFWSGILLILLRWPLVGFVVQCYGMFILFGEFFKTIAGFAYNVPVVGPFLAKGLNAAGDKAGAEERRHKDLPV
ncbi:probable protein GOT1 [Ramularia collo-cygni]|uniref:Probable protein GOT1 n=1 Tax=Ramularia collo-cygni TaxID=112498 RepID=A0A2D3US27_9PEZI|nr:probable protein GOT1 [Ramularia collo-cygni]CZT16465.1 probable protein GOT1 [Ramularia collo-cygni]